MPELPEVETVRLGLLPHLEGRKILKATAFSPKLRLPVPEEFSATLECRRISAITRRAKYLLFDADDNLTIMLHLGMSGQVHVSGGENAKPFKPKKHDHFVWDMEGGSRLVFHDPRRFGLVTFCKTNMLDNHSLLSHLGPEPLSNRFNGPALKEKLTTKKVDIKAALLDQRVVAGVGNIYASEALYRAGIHPKRKAGSLSLDRCEKLATAVRDVLNDALQSGGSSLRDYVRVDGELGYFQHRFDVYDCEGTGCRTKACPGTIKRIVQGARSTFYCPQCQR